MREKKCSDKRTRMQRKKHRQTIKGTICLFACAVLAFWLIDSRITLEELKAQEGALKCEIEASRKIEGDNAENRKAVYIEEYPIDYPITEDDRETLEHIVEGEAGGESYEGKLWVATCLRNAMEKDNLSAEQVRISYQYAGWSEKVSEDTKNAVKEVFVFGNKMHDSVLWFYAPEWCESEWHESQQFVAEIGGHRFFCQKGAEE